MYRIIETPEGSTADRQSGSPPPRGPDSTGRDIADSVGDVLVSSGRLITNHRDAFYMARYVELIGPWFDLFNISNRHFSDIVPQLALDNESLRLACLAAAARQYSLVSSIGEEDALTYYNNALRLLSYHLESRPHEPATFASCLLIAHCEMIESKAGNWNVHLQGTCELVKAQGYNGRTGGLAEAVCPFLNRVHTHGLLTVARVFLDIL